MSSVLERAESDSMDVGLEEAKRNQEEGQWARACALGGVGVWAALALFARLGWAPFGEIELLFLFAVLGIVPLGMELGRTLGANHRLERLARRVQPVAAACAVLAMWLAPGTAAGLAAVPWLVICFLMGSAGLFEIFSWRENAGSGATLLRIALTVARADLVVGGMWLVASRLGIRPMGIQEPIGLLTAVHFHFAGFGTAMIAAAMLRFSNERGGSRWLPPTVKLVICMPFVVAAGFVLSPRLKMTAAIIFSASVAGLAVGLRGMAKKIQHSTARRLLLIASASVFAGMVLSGIYAAADLRSNDVLTIPQMARTHGILNAIGFCMTALLGWLVEYHGTTSDDRNRAARIPWAD